MEIDAFLDCSDLGALMYLPCLLPQAVRLIKIQCPGVKHADVEIELVFNGCEVIIRRQASRGVIGSTWTRRFQFKPSDGLFEFREDLHCWHVLHCCHFVVFSC